MTEININSESWDLIKSGVKTRELRLGDDEQLMQLKIDRPLVFVNRTTGDRVKRWLVAKHLYPTTEAAAAVEPLPDFGYNLNKQEFIKRIRQWQSKDEEELAGVIVLEFA